MSNYDVPLVKYNLHLDYFLDQDTNDFYTPEEIIAYHSDLLNWELSSPVYFDKKGRRYALIKG